MNLHTLNTQDPAPEKGSVQSKTNTLFVKQLDQETAEAYVSDSYGKVLKIITQQESPSTQKLVTNVEVENIYNENTLVKFSFSDGTQTSFEAPNNLDALIRQSNLPMYDNSGILPAFSNAILGVMREAFNGMGGTQMHDLFSALLNNYDFSNLLKGKVEEILAEKGL